MYFEWGVHRRVSALCVSQDSALHRPTSSLCVSQDGTVHRPVSVLCMSQDFPEAWGSAPAVAPLKILGISYWACVNQTVGG